MNQVRALLPEEVKSFVRPWVQRTRAWVYRRRFRARLREVTVLHGGRVRPAWTGVGPEAKSEWILKRLREVVPKEVQILERPVDLSSEASVLRQYWEKNRDLYQNVGNGREKALEHALLFQLFDTARIHRHCDVAASASPLEKAISRSGLSIEYWKQDLVYQTDLNRRVVGGLAQSMTDVPSGFFDSLTLHCSFEHFEGGSDSEFVKEVDRVLSKQGVCLIVPLYIDLEPKIFLDPTTIPDERIAGFDSEATLCPAYDYRQEHGRYYSPETLVGRVLSHIPQTLQATLIRFRSEEAGIPEIYLRFGLVLHRPGFGVSQPRDEREPKARKDTHPGSSPF